MLLSRQPGLTLAPDREIAEADAQVVASTDAGVVVELRWREKASDETYRHYQALKLRGGLVFDMQDYRQQKHALAALGR